MALPYVTERKAEKIAKAVVAEQGGGTISGGDGDTQFVATLKFNGVDYKLDVVGNSPEPEFEVAGEKYFHRLDTQNLSLSNEYYDMAGNVLSVQPENYPYIKKFGPPSEAYFQVVSSGYGQFGQQCSVSITESTASGSITEGPITISNVIANNTLSSEYFTKAYLKLENGNYVLYFSLATEGSITGPVSNETLEQELATKQDILTADNGITISNNKVKTKLFVLDSEGYQLSDLTDGAGVGTYPLVEKNAFISMIELSNQGVVRLRKGYCILRYDSSTTTYQITSISGEYTTGFEVITWYGIPANQLINEFYILNSNNVGQVSTLKIPPILNLDTTKTYSLKFSNGSIDWVQDN